MTKKNATRRNVVYLSGLAALLVLLVAAGFAYFGASGEPSDAAPIDDAVVARTSAPQPAPSVEPASTSDAAECGYNPDVPVYEGYESLISFRDPIKGNPSAPVTVIEYFDPNCPHCRNLYPIMDEVAKQYGDQAKFVYIPFVLWPNESHPRYSLTQAEALHAAAQEGKFFEMLERQLSTSEERLSMEQLQEIATEIGMDAERMKNRIESDAYVDVIMQQRSQGQATGITGMPAVFVNGRLVDSASRTVECMGELIEEAASEAAAEG